MRWSKEADEAVAKVPFFVRKRVRKRVEEEAARAGASAVDLEHVQACQKRFLKQMEEEVKGFQVETCFGASGCPHRAIIYENFAQQVEEH
ncbi:MAG: PCP reductase family protein, partial [Deltaproteobacteria bacterium]|nr:PCP reductase family protein [Deltaproteobacteria bacterium]